MEGSTMHHSDSFLNVFPLVQFLLYLLLRHILLHILLLPHISETLLEVRTFKTQIICGGKTYKNV